MTDDRATRPDASGAGGNAGFNQRFNPAGWVRRHQLGLTLAALVSAFVLVSLWNTILVAKKSGEQGVYWSRFFGGTSSMILGEGTHLKFPWDEIVIYDIRVLMTRDRTVLLTRDGMQIEVDWAARYRVNPDALPQLHRTIGPQFSERVVVPEVVSSLRQVIGNYTADEIYARDEEALIHEIERRTKKRIHIHPIILEEVLMLRLALPDDMAKSIVDKLIFEQNLLAYRFRLQAEEEERKRKSIEAEGIKAFEETSGISILKWRGIHATTEIAKSPNTKIIIMGTGPNGLPLLLNADK